MTALDAKDGAQELRSLHEAVLVDTVTEVWAAQCLYGESALRKDPLRHIHAFDRDDGIHLAVCKEDRRTADGFGRQLIPTDQSA